MTASVRDQARALRESAGVRVRDDLTVVHVRGDDAPTWLNGQVTSDVREVPAGHGVYGLAVTVRGKIMADLWVVHSGGDLAVVLPKSAVETVLASFEHQIIMDDVELVPDDGLAIISVQGPKTGAVIDAAALPDRDSATAPALRGGASVVERQRCDELGHGGELILVAEPERATVFAALVAQAERVGGCAVDDEGLELARLRAGRPRFERDFGPEQYPQEAGLEERAVSFSKGCYLGQEVICTLENRGRLTRRLARLTAAQGALAPGSELQDDDARQVGKVTSAAFDPESGRLLALGYVKRAAATAGATLHAGSASVELAGLV
jgi:folate-binding protein YgfZ